MKEKWINFLVTKPKTSLVSFFLSLLLFIPGIMSIQEDFTYSIWYNDSDQLMQLFKHFQKRFGNDDQAIIGIYNEKGVFNKREFDLLSKITEEVLLLRDVVRVEALTNANIIEATEDEIIINPLYDPEKKQTFEQMRKVALKDNAIRDVYVDSQGKFATLAVTVREDFNSVPDYYTITQQINKILKKYEDEGWRFYRAGSVVMTYWFKQVTIDDLNILAPMALGLFTLLLFFFYRRAAGIYIPLLIILTSVIIMNGLAGYLGHTFNTISSAAPTILLTVALADAIHLLTYYFYSLNKGLDNISAVRESLTKNFYPTLITSITTCLGFMSFSTSMVIPIADLGVQVGLGVVVAWIASYVLCSSILILRPVTVKGREHKHSIDPLKRIKQRVLDFVLAHQKSVLASAIVLGAICMAGVSTLYVSMDPIKQFTRSHEVAQDYYFIEKQMNSASTLEIMIEAFEGDDIQNPKFLQQVELFTKELLSRDNIFKATSIIDILKKMNQTINADNIEYYRLPTSKEAVAQLLLLYTLGLPEGQSINQLVSLTKDSMRLTAYWNILNSSQALAVIEEINLLGKKYGLSLKVTGKMPLFHNLTPYVVNTFFVSFATALILITLIMILVLASVKLGLLTLIPNLIPLMIGGGIVYLAQFQVDIGIVIVASVCLGIAVDDSIHILFEYRRHRQTGKSLRESFEIIYEGTLPALFITTLIIAIGFGSFYFADYLPNSRFGVLVAIILSFAFIADALLFPVIMGIFDKFVNLDKN